MDSLIDETPASKRLRPDEFADVNIPFETPTKLTELTVSTTEKESAPNVLDVLNDHCIQEIFKRISIYDLSSATEVCTRFKQNAEQIFSLCHEKQFHFVSLTLVKPAVFHNFVHLFKTVYLNGSQVGRCLECFNECSAIKHLHLRSADIDVEKLKPLLPKLTDLTISNCDFIGEKLNLLSHCGELLYLKWKLSNFDQLSPCNIPKLQRFEFEDYHYTENLRSFVKANYQLSSISITTVNKLRTPIDFAIHLQEFGNFKSLNLLKLPCFQFSVTPLIRCLVSSKIPMQQLELTDCRILDESIRDILQMKLINNLALTGIETFSRHQLIDLAKELPTLEVLRLETPHKQNLIITFDDIISFVKHSKNLFSLTIGIIHHLTIDQDSYNHLLDLLIKDQRKTLSITIIYENAVKISVPKSTLLKHKNRIRIIKIKYDDYDGDNNASESDDNNSDDSDFIEADGDNDDGSDSSEDSDESWYFSSLLGSVDDSDDNSDDNWLEDE